jgi:hypothetical protein
MVALRLSLSLLLLIVPLATAAGQFPPRASRAAEPPQWVSLSLGFMQPFTVRDGTTRSTWEFSSAVQLRAAYEQRIRHGGAIGLAAGFATVPLTYYAGVPRPGCGNACDAEASVTQVLATFRSGGSLGFHQLFELAIGGTGYGSFRQTEGGAALPPDGTDIDLTVAIGYGFGYGMSPSTHFFVVQDVGTALHQRTGLTARESSFPRIYVTRIGARVGF